MTEVTRAEFEQLRHTVDENVRHLSRQDTRFAVINTKLTAILWLLAAVGTAVIAAVVRLVFGVSA